MTRHAIWVVGVALLGLLWPGAASAQDDPGSRYQYQSTGFAVPTDQSGLPASASDVYEAMVDRHPAPDGSIIFRFLVWRPGIEQEVVFDSLFIGIDNMVNFSEPGVIVFPYHAESLTNGVTFRLDGNQVDRFVSGEGVYGNYHFAVSAHTVAF